MTLQKPLQINFSPEKDLKTGTIHYFQTQLGFNFDNLKTSDLPISLQIKNQNYDLQIVFQLTDEEIKNTNFPVVEAMPSSPFPASLKYSKYLVCSYDFGELEKIPSKSFLANFNRQLSGKFDSISGMPNLIIFRYTVNNKTYITFSVSELREKPNQRNNKFIATKVILLKDINISEPHRGHLDILEKLKQSYSNFDQLHENWLKVLDLKVLSDEFYKQVLIRYNDLVSEIILPTQNNPGENVKKDFALRLVGRLIFCWFLKAKDWVGEGVLSSKNTLFSNGDEGIASTNQNFTYYHQILEPLFFESLNKDPKDRDFENKRLFEDVPYLNGGLFEAKADDYYKSEQKDHLDRIDHGLKVPNQQIQDIFKLFEEYYFTIDENTSTEQEIGVDPEMMGRIFENFILNRSSTGSFYTPREIVDYMVEMSLLEVMETKINYMDLTVDYFLELTKKDDHTLTGIVEDYPKRRFVTGIKGNSFEISFYLLAKLRGWHLANDRIIRITHRHIEINYDFWSSFLGQNFEIEVCFFAKSKDVYVQKVQVKIPKIGIVININQVQYVLILSFSSAGFWIIDTCYQLFGNKLAKLKKDAKANLAELKGFWTNKNTPREDIQFFEVDGYYHRAHSERQLSEIFTVFQRIYSKIINKEQSLVKFFSANKIQKFLDGVFCNTKRSMKNDKKDEINQILKSLKILDPACGSGAFPMGVLQKLTDLKHILEPEKSLYEIKLQILQNSIYGVDLLPIAVEISRLRCWLSLVVDEDKKDPKPLPNLEFKFVCANSLVGIDRKIFEAEIQEDLIGSVDIVKNSLKELDAIRIQTFLPAQNKQNLSDKWDKITTSVFSESNKLQTKNAENLAKEALKITSWNPFENKPAEFFDPEWMFGESGFDLVIGNPPYVQLQKDGGILGKQFEKSGYQTFAKTGDLYQLFYEKGYDLLKQNSILAYITSNKWMRAGYGKTTRQFLSQKTNPKMIIDLGANVFESATVDSNILIFQKANNQGQTKATKATKSELEKGSPNFTTINFDNSDGWFIGSPSEIALKKKIESVGKPLKDWDVKILSGVKTGLNEAFIIDENKKNELIAKDPKSAEIIKPILRGRDIKRYGYEFAGLYVINAHNGYVEETPSLHNGKQGLSSTKIPPININDYPAIKEHLDSFEPALSKRSDKGVTPYNLRNCAYLDEFEKEKVVYPETTLDNNFTYCEGGYFIDKTGFIMVGDNLKFILGVLCSTLFRKVFRLLFAGITLGEKGFQLNKDYLEKFPIPTLNTPEKQQIAGQIELLVEEILLVKNLPLAKGSNSQSLGVNNIEPQSATQTAPFKGAMDTTHLENQIDELVFELYGLTSEEIGVILGF
jgi:type I restriction-modification system DNA methylase subunit